MYSYCKGLLAVLLFASLSATGQVLPIKRSAPSVLARDANVQAYQVVIIPVVTDTTTALSYGIDSLGMLIQVRSTGKQYKRDTVPTGGHVWTEIGSGGTGSSNTSVGGKIALAITGTNNVKSIDTAWGTTLDSSHANIVKIGADSQSVASKKYVQQQRDSLGGVIGGKLASISTGNSVTGNGTSGSPVQLAGDAPSPGNSQYYGTNGSGAKGYYSLPSGVTSADPSVTIGFTPKNGSASTFMRSDAAPALDTVTTLIRGDGFNQQKYKQIIDSNQSIHSYLSVGRGNKLADSLTFLLLAKLDSNQSIHSWASVGRINKIADSLSGLFMRTVDSNQSIHSWASTGRLNKIADSLSHIFLATVSVTNSITGDGATNPLKLSGDAATPGANKTYGTDGSGVKGWKNDPSGGGGGSFTPPGTAKQVIIHSNNGNYAGTATNFTADSVTGLVNMDTLRAHKAKVDSVVWSNSPWTTPSNMLFFGDSWTAGTRVDGAPNPLFTARLGTIYGKSVTNDAVAGTGIAQAVTNMNTISIPVSSFTHVMVGLNDPRYSDGTHMLQTINEIINGHSMLYAIQYAATAVQASTTGSGARKGGAGWANENFGNRTMTGRGTGIRTTAQNDSSMFDFTDSTVYAAIIGHDTLGATYDVFIDTVKVAQGTSNRRADGISKLGVTDHFIEYSFIVRGLPYGPHTLKFVKTSASTSDTLSIDYYGTMKPVSSGTPMLINEQPYMTNVGYTASPAGSSLLIARTINVTLDSFYYSPSIDRRYPVRLGKENKRLDTLSTMSSDGIHLNNYRGDSMQVLVCLDQFPTIDPALIKAVMRTGNRLMHVNMNGVDKDLAMEDESARDFAVELNNLRASAGAINVTQNTVAMGTSTAGSTVGNSPITINGNNVGIGVPSPINLLDLKATHPAVWLTDGTSGAGGIGVFNNTISFGVNRNPSSGVISFSGQASAAIDMTSFSGSSQINFRLGATNNGAGTVLGSMFPNAHFVWGSATPTDNTTTWGTNMVFRADGGLWVNGITNPANKPNIVIQGNGQTVWANAGNTANFSMQLDSNRNAFRMGITNLTFSFAKNYTWFDFATGDLHDSGRLYVEDTLSLKARASYRGNIGASFTDNSLVDKHYVDSADATHSGTSPIKFSQTSDGTALTNTTSAANITGTGVGSASVAANSLSVGDVVEVEMSATLSTDATSPGSLSFSSVFGGFTVLSPQAGLSNVNINIKARTTILTTGGGGTQSTEICVIIPNNTYTAKLTGSINTASTMNFGITAQWGSALSSNSIQSVAPTTVRVN